MRSESPLFELGIDLASHPRIALGASAGTGKTYTLQALAVRNLIEGHCAIGELLMVTFTKAAAAEMRQRLVKALEETVALCDANWAGQGDTNLAAIVRSDDPEVLALRQARAKHALADIDQAVVTTLDAFWAMMTHWLDIAPEGELNRIDDHFVAESTVNHFLIKSAHLINKSPIKSRSEALKVVKELFNVPDTRLDLAKVSLDNPTEALGALANRAVRLAKEIREKGNSYAYSDVLDALDAYVPAIDEPDPLGHRDQVGKLIDQFKVVMVDEVQDTNEAQLRLLKKLFIHRPIHLYLVGDPKQAIYEFRGGDINAWDDARRWVEEEGAEVESSFNLNTNFRSDGPVVEAINALFAPQHFSYSTGFSPVEANHQSPRIFQNGEPLTPCVFRSVDIKAYKDETIVATIRDVVRYCAQLLSGDITMEREDGTGVRPITPGDICVLVRRNDDIFKLNNALLSAGIPSLMASGNVLQSEAATYWLDLLEALAERPDPGALTTLTVGPWLRGSALSEEDIWTLTLEWRQVLERFGPGALMEAVDASTGFAANLLARPEGRRLLTDLEHVGELLDGCGEWGRRRWFEWLTQATYSFDMRAEEERRRLDLDGGAVELRTSHSAKGLERAIVLVPFAWINTQRQAMSVPALYYRKDAEDDQRFSRYLGLDMTKPGVADWAVETAQFANQRLLYVEMTRAKHHVAIWHQDVSKGLGTVHQLVAQALIATPSDGSVGGHDGSFFGMASALAQAHPTLFAAQQSSPEDPIPDYSPVVQGAAGGKDAPLPARDEPVVIDFDWRRSSFSGWVSEQDDTEGVTFDEPDADIGDETTIDDGVHGDAVTLSVMPSGAETGTAVHHIYEVIDFTDPDVVGEIEGLLAKQHAGPLSELDDDVRSQVASGLAQVLHTPLGGPLGSLTLAQVGRTHRADEMAYELSVHDEGAPGLSLRDLGRLWVANVDEDDPFYGYAKRLAERGDERVLKGYLLGFIDLVLQHDHPDGRVTWTVMDYKTNRIAIPGVEVLRQDHYQQRNLRLEMEVHHYPLQSLLYQVALHRYLRASLVGYDPETHLGGSAYLFVRGMSGEPANEVRALVESGEGGPGVMWWTPPARLIEAVDQAFMGERP